MSSSSIRNPTALALKSIGSLYGNPHVLRKKFSLRMIKKIHFNYCPLMLKEVNKGAKDFYDRCWAPKTKTTNPDCSISIDVYDNNADSKPPSLIIEFEDGRKLDFSDVSYVSTAAIMEAIQLKKKKIKKYYQTVGKDYYETEDEENPLALQDKKDEEEAMAGAKKKKKK
ncbi:predicted protein [Naegleria gruberi]|uniref:Predicted protein n=1 Tax=Naegleria gruberi TaxID=5762 RepID=D2UZF4_NAEGR|nr:uncharacterized protein NAEGRDRAFT_45463 [Naegleria gruberi]EFC49941.1 predicted protein [Naegleria gruberi]|eukprot:XP_002682685.1 predicted protein [Naegleria gruberi strain NEG-M]